MKPKVIKSEADYEAALAAVEELWDAKPGSAEGDALELWSVLIETYEEEHHPIELPDPVEAIKFRMEQAGLKNKDLVPFIGSASKVSEVLNGKRALSMKMIRALHEGLGIPADVLIGETQKELPEEVPGLDFDKFPIAEMLKRGYFGDFRGTVAQAKQNAEGLIRGMAPGMDLAVLQPALLRCHVRSNGSFDPYALAAWQLRIHSRCRDVDLPEYEDGTIEEDFIDELVHLSALKRGPKLAREYLTKYGIALFVEDHLPKTHLDGAAMWHEDRPVVGLTLRYDRTDNFWFTLAHELAHFALHIPKPATECFMDDLRERRGDDKEDEADRLAARCLIPDEEWEHWREKERPSVAHIQAFARRLRIDPAIVAGRVRRESDNYKRLTPLVKHSVRDVLGVER
jgi:HTH-type transcriptional regulator / antitoxin HigA